MPIFNRGYGKTIVNNLNENNIRRGVQQIRKVHKRKQPIPDRSARGRGNRRGRGIFGKTRGIGGISVGRLNTWASDGFIGVISTVVFGAEPGISG